MSLDDGRKSTFYILWILSVCLLLIGGVFGWIAARICA